MTIVYIAGPYRGPNSWAVEQNIRRAEELALEVWRLGAAALCPHCNTRFFQGAAPDALWLAGDLAMLQRCDAVLFTKNWRESSGAVAEHDKAVAWGVPVFFNLTTLRAWLLNQPVESGRRPADQRLVGFDN